ncbi:FAD-dependent oxidoreductase [Desulfonema magnum]|uniref:FAD-dependent pyridine nucleotide-disulfide oxidoreductase n=1 Tax=Desulfonema magnum TaxID=45655 RepID=A0A975GNI0_9BACT|nr:FAD-dependent oxidoreductase [Desulfonema magnum]QTA87794.1 FAD-dependent pyridine nucleotide-disulfide oxidoreductase [Desulfonema magnum]
MDFLVIGGDAAGMSAASRAKRNKPDLNVTVLERSTDVSYSACGMPYNIADPAREIDDLVVRHAKVFRENQNINVLTGHCAETIDPADRTVSGVSSEGKAFKLPYDKLLIATGASPIIPDIPGTDLPGVMALKFLEDGRKIKGFLNHVKKVVIIGMGYIALEMCEALRSRNIDVDMVKPRPVFLPWMEQNMAQVVREEIQSHGVRLYPGHSVERIEKSAGGLKVVCPELTLEGDMVLLAIGVTPNSALAAEAGLKTGVKKAIATDNRLCTSDKNIFAAGDCADALHLVTGQKTWIPLALRANRAGWAVADNVCGRDVQLQGIVGTAVFKVFDFEVARAGLNAEEAAAAGFEPAEVMIRTSSRAHAHPGASKIWVYMTGDKKSGRLLGVQMVGREGAAHRINAPAVALHSEMTVEQFAQSDLAYAPPFGPVWDPLLTAANQLLKKM